MATGEGGPYVAVAVFCEKVLHERDGVVSLVRLVDNVTRTIQGSEPPDEMPPTTISMSLVLRFKAGSARGRQTIRVVPEKPSGERGDPLAEFPLHFDASSRGVQTIINLELQLDQEGVWWFDVILVDPGLCLTRVPLTLVYAPQKTT